MCVKICVNGPLQLVMKQGKAVGMKEVHLSSPLLGQTVPFLNVMSVAASSQTLIYPLL